MNDNDVGNKLISEYCDGIKLAIKFVEADAIIIKIKTKLVNNKLFSLPIMSVGFVFSASTIWNPNLMFLQSYAWIIGALISSITYYFLAKK